MAEKMEKNLMFRKGISLMLRLRPLRQYALTGNGKNEEWPANEKWDIRVPIKVFNFGKNKSEALPVYVNMEQVYLRLHNESVQYAPDADWEAK